MIFYTKFVTQQSLTLTPRFAENLKYYVKEDFRTLAFPNWKFIWILCNCCENNGYFRKQIHFWKKTYGQQNLLEVNDKPKKSLREIWTIRSNDYM